MVIAKLEGRKTQTRRIVKPEPIQLEDCSWTYGKKYSCIGNTPPSNDPLFLASCPYGYIGDWLWARETTLIGPFGKPTYKASITEEQELIRKDNIAKGNLWAKWTPSIHVPKRYSRIWEEITDVRVEHLQDISPGDACDEGIEYDNVDIEALNGGELVADFRNYTWRDDPDYEDYYFPTYASCVDSYRSLWESINGPSSWSLNPWVWVITTKILSTTGRPEKL